MSAQREQEFITTVRAASRAVWDGILALKASQSEYTALDYGNTLDDGAGGNAGITKADVEAVVLTTTNALLAILATGHATNMAKLL